MKNDLEHTFSEFVALHGCEAWEAFFRVMTNPLGFCECGRPGQSYDVGATSFVVCDVCKTCWFYSQRHTVQTLSQYEGSIEGFRFIEPRWPLVVINYAEFLPVDQVADFFSSYL